MHLNGGSLTRTWSEIEFLTLDKYSFTELAFGRVNMDNCSNCAIICTYFDKDRNFRVNLFKFQRRNLNARMQN